MEQKETTPMDSTSVRKRLTELEQKQYGRVYCSHGAHHVSPEGGFWKPTVNGRKRFVCAQCRKDSSEKRKKSL